MNSNNPDKNGSCETLRVADIWLENGNIDIFKTSNLLSKILQSGDFNEFENIYNKLQTSTFAEKLKSRLLRADIQRNNIIHITREADKNPSINRVILKPFDANKKEIQALDDIFNLEQGLYFRNNKNEQFETFDKDFSSYTEEMKTFFREKGFARALSRRNQERFRVIDNARVYAFNHNFYAISDEGGYYDSTNAARLAKLSYVNYVGSNDNHKEYIDKAVFLPIDHACNNYYHALSECFGGLKFISELPPEVPIVYTEDRFGVLDFIASRLCIDRSRFIPMKDLSNTIINKALQLFPYSFTWNQDTYLFFKNISYPQTVKSKIYVSRRKSSRGPTNEPEVENEMKALGFDIVYAEELSFAQQVFTFSNASVLVGPHGAGLTNILFMPENSSLIEIFNKDFIPSDFYLRSRHNNMRYACSIQSENLFNIDELKEAIARCDS